MSNAELARQAIENRQDRFEATEAYRYGGEEGSEVLPINEEQVKTAENLIKRFGVSIERKLQNDPENLTQAEVILLDLQKKPEGEPYSPHEMAGLYLVMRHMEGELNNPNSAISQERQFGQGHTERDTTRDEWLEEVTQLEKDLYWNLTRLDKDRGLEVDEIKTGLLASIGQTIGSLREAADRQSPTAWNGKMARIQKGMNFLFKNYKSRTTLESEKATAEATKEKFFEDNKNFLTLEQDISLNQEAGWNRILTELEADGTLTATEAAAVKSATDKERELRKYISGRGSTARRNEILTRVNNEAVDLALEKQFSSELDALVDAVIEREADPEASEELEDLLVSLDSKIKEKEKELHTERSRKNGARRPQEKKIEDELEALKKRRTAAEAALNLAEPKSEKDLRKDKNKSLGGLSTLTGVPEADLEDMLKAEYGVSNTADVEARLNGENSISLWKLLIQLLTGTAKKES